MAVAAYTAGAPLLKGERAQARHAQFLEQEQEHADALSHRDHAAGGTPIAPKASYDFPRVRTQHDVLLLANMIENTAIAAYIDALPKLASPDLRATAAAIVTNEAEHVSVLLGALGREQVPARSSRGGVSMVRASIGWSSRTATPTRRRSRRSSATGATLVRRGIVIGGAVVAASSLPLLVGAQRVRRRPDGDAAILASAIRLERIAVAAYAAAIDSGLPDAAVRGAPRRFRPPGGEHAAALTTALKDLGGTPPVGHRTPRLLASLRASAKPASRWPSFAIELEPMAVAAYYDAQRKLRAARLLQTGASIMANEAQHLVVLRQALGRDPVPNAFENGKASA